MKFILGVISIIVGIFMGLYVGIWWAFVGGIIEIVNGVQAVPANGSDIAIGICRVVFATGIGEVIAGFFFVLGLGLFGLDIRSKRRKRI